MFRELRVMDHQASGAGLRQTGDVVGQQSKIDRHPHRAQAKAGEHGLDELIGVASLHKHAITLRDSARPQPRRQRLDPAVYLAPCPFLLAPDKAKLVGIAPRRLPQDMGQVHHPVGNALHRTRSMIET